MMFSKREVVLNKVDEFCDDDMYFDAYAPDCLMESLHIPRATWVDMGSPETLTLTIEPGDKLNE